MQTEQGLGLVIRGTDFSETSRIATIWTTEHGKIRALAKGGRRIRSNFDVAFDLLNVCRVVWIRKASGLDLLIEAQLQERFPWLRQDLTALYASYYLAELLDATADYDPHPRLFEATLATLRAWADPRADRVEGVCRFELVWLSELGYSPTWTSCGPCGQLVDLAAHRHLGYSAGVGVICERCLTGLREVRPLSHGAWQILWQLSEGQPPDPAEWQPTRIREIRGHLAATISSVLGKQPRLASYVDGLIPKPRR